MLTILKLAYLKKNSSNSLALKLRICVRFAAIFNVERVAVLIMTWSYVRTAMIVSCNSNY